MKSNHHPAVSIIMPVYNAEKFLHDSVGSILIQTCQDFELICFNDASTDGSLRLLKEFAAPSIHPSINPSIHTSIHPSINPSINQI